MWASRLAMAHVSGVGSFCASSTSTLCDSSSDCPGSAACNSVGQRRCRGDPTVFCTSDVDCSGSDQCLVDELRVAQTQAILAALQLPSMGNFTSYLADAVGTSSSISAEANGLLATVSLPTETSAKALETFVACAGMGSTPCSHTCFRPACAMKLFRLLRPRRSTALHKLPLQQQRRQQLLQGWHYPPRPRW